MTNAVKFFNVYEKPEASDPTDRVVLLREGFVFWALILGPLWLVANRRWLVFAGYVLALIVAQVLCVELALSEVTTILVQVWLQVLLAFHANDLQDAVLKRKGYRFAGVLVAESEMQAQIRYYEHAA